MSPKYRVLTGDNFNFYEEEGCADFGTYETAEEAIVEAKAIVDKSIRWERWQATDQTDTEELYDRYTDFGESPSIHPPTVPPFSAWGYAKTRCVEICGEPPEPRPK